MIRNRTYGVLLYHDPLGIQGFTKHDFNNVAKVY